MHSSSQSFLITNCKIAPLLLELSLTGSNIRAGMTSEGAKLLVNPKYGFDESFKSVVLEFIENETLKLEKSNLVNLHRLYIDNEPGPVFENEEKAYAFIGLKNRSTINNNKYRIKKIAITKEDRDQLLVDTMDSLSAYKKVVAEINQEVQELAKIRKANRRKNRIDFNNENSIVSVEIDDA